jgi:site-specific DNA-methyltransferase (adenine-specific)
MSAKPFTEKYYLNRVLSGDCIELMGRLPDNCVDMVLCDLPYGTTRNKWDSPIDLETLWALYHRVAKPNAPFVFTAAQPFTSALVMSNLSEFKVEWIWSKTVGSGQLNIKHQPLRTHESILVFYRELPVYNPQMTDGTPYSFTRKATYEGPGYNKQRDVDVSNTGQRYPKTVLSVPNPRIKAGHSTQKPVPLFEYLINTYSNPGAVILDNCVGSGTTAIAAINTNRNFIAMEQDPKHVLLSRTNIIQAKRLKK